MSTSPSQEDRRQCPDCGESYTEVQGHVCSLQRTLVSGIAAANATQETLPTAGPAAQATQETLPIVGPVAQARPAEAPLAGPVAETRAADLIGTTLGGRYQIIKPLSRGGIGVVYLARHVILDNPMAVKVLRKPQDVLDQQRFLREAKLASKISHPNTVYIADFGVLPGGLSYLVMEYIKGSTLQDVLKQGRLDVLRACRIALQIARGLQAVHDRGIIHRDLKPANVFVLDHGGRDFVKIVDFGLAKATGPEPGTRSTPSFAAHPDSLAESGTELTVPGVVIGTPAYLSPEQAKGEVADARADQYSLGCMLFEMLSGSQPYSSGSVVRTVMMHVREPVPSVRQRCPEVAISDSLEALLDRLMAKQPAERFGGMKEVAAALEREVELLRLQRGERVALSASLASLLGPRLSGNHLILRGRKIPLRAAAALLVLALAVLVTGTVYLGYRSGRQPEARQGLLPGELAAARQAALAVLGEDLRGPDRDLRRRSIAALGRTHDGAHRATLEALLGDQDPAMAAQAAEALGELGERQATGALRGLLAPGGSAALGLAAASALIQLGDEQGAAYLERLVQQGLPEQRLRAAFLLCERGRGDAGALALLSGASEAPGVPEQVALSILTCLARSPHPQAAVQRLSAWLQRTAQLKPKIPIAARLAQLGDPAGRALLRQAALEPGPEQLPAARALASPDEWALAVLFRRVLGDPRAEPAARLLAAEGLGLSGEPLDVRLLHGQLRRGTDPGLRQAGAAAILQLAAREPGALSAQGLQWARSVLGDQDWAIRDAAVAVLGDSPEPSAVELLTPMLKDQDSRVRRSTARALGRRPERAALLALRDGLRDPDPEVRLQSLQSMGRLSRLAHGQGGQDQDRELQGWLREVQAQDQATWQERVLSGTILAQLGDQEQRRRLLALAADDDFAVRLAAARGLVELGDGSALPVLREALGRGGAEAMEAYALLYRRGERPAAPADLEAALGTGTSVLDRMQAIEDIGRLPGAVARPLLLLAARDPERLVRRLVAEVAADLQAAPPGGPPGADVLRLLTADSDAGVRARAAVLLASLVMPAMSPAAQQGHQAQRRDPAGDGARPVPQAVQAAAVPDLATPAPRDAGADRDARSAAVTDRAARSAAVIDTVAGPQAESPPAEPGGGGTLVIEARPGVWFQVDQLPWQPAAGKAIAIELPAGRHQVRYLGGEQEVEVAQGRGASLRLEESPVEQAIRLGEQAYAAKDYGQAQRLFERASSHCARDRRHAGACANLALEVGLDRGRLFEEQRQWDQAMTEYQRVARSAARGRFAALKRISAQEAVVRLAPHVGQVVIRRVVDGQCHDETLWLLPGKQTVIVGGRRQEITVGARDVVTLGACP